MRWQLTNTLLVTIVVISGSIMIFGFIPIVIITILSVKGKASNKLNRLLGIFLLCFGISGLALGSSFTAIYFPKEPTNTAMLPAEVLNLPIAVTTDWLEQPVGGKEDKQKRVVYSVVRDGLIAVNEKESATLAFRYSYKSIEGNWVFKWGELRVNAEPAGTSVNRDADTDWGDKISSVGSEPVMKDCSPKATFNMPALDQYMHQSITLETTAEIISPQLTNSKSNFFNEKKELTSSYKLYVVTADEMEARRNYDAWNNRWNPLNYWWVVVSLAVMVFGIRNIARFKRERKVNATAPAR